MTTSKSAGAAQKKRHESALGAVQREKNSVPFRTSSYSQLYAAYVDMQWSHWDATWAFYAARRMRKRRFVQGRRSQSVLDQTVNRLCAPHPGDTRTLLVYGNAATTNSFGKIRGTVKGPAKKLFDMALRDKKATTVWADEFRTSKLDIYGHDLIHPPERRHDRLVPAPCKSQAHGEGVPGCKHLCAQTQLLLSEFLGDCSEVDDPITVLRSRVVLRRQLRAVLRLTTPHQQDSEKGVVCLDPILSRMLVSRGLTTQDKAARIGSHSEKIADMAGTSVGLRLSGPGCYDASFNVSQLRALGAAMLRRLTLVQGPPGTGKTRVAIAILDAWVQQGNNLPVLETADSNIAVDNLVSGCLSRG